MNLTLNISTGNTVKLNLPSQQTVLTAVSTVNNLTVSSVGIPGATGAAGADGMQNIVEDTTPQLGGDLDMNNNSISSGVLGVKNTGSQSELRLYCESSNAHYVAVKAPPHAEFSGNHSFQLPPDGGTDGFVLKTDGSGNTSWTSNGLQNLVEDTTPQLGGNLDVNGKKITSTSNGDIDIEPNGTGDVLLGNFKFDADQSVGVGQDNHVLTYDNSTQKISLEAPSGVGGLSNIVEDTSPQLGGSLDVNGNKITSTSNGDIDIEPNGTGDVLLGNFKFDADQSVGSGQDNHVLTYDNSTQKISLEAPSGGGGSGAVLSYCGAGSVDLQTAERFIPMTGGTFADFSSQNDPMKAVIPLAATLGTVCVRVGAGSVDAVIKVYKGTSPIFTSASTTWSSAGDIQIFTVNSGSYAAGDTFSVSIDQSTSVDMNYVVASVTFNLAAAPAGTAISNVVEDTTPQLGGDLDVNGHEIISGSNGDIELNPHGTGDVKLGNFTFDVDQTVGAGQDNHVLTYDNSSGKISLEASAGGGGGGSSTTPQRFALGFETQLTSGNYFFGNLRYGWNYVAWNRSDNNMQLSYFELVSAMVPINDYTAINVKGIAGSMLTSNSVTIEFSLWKGTNSGGTGTLATTEIASTTVDYSQSDEMKPLSFGATGLTIDEGDYIFFAIRNTSYSVREDVACSITITFS